MKDLTLWKKTYLHLKKRGFDVYSLGQKRDACENPYLVIKENGVHALSSNVNGYKLFNIIIYYPKNNYSDMEMYIEHVKDSIVEIPELRPTGNETPVIIDADVGAYTSSIEYQFFKSLRKG